MRRSILKECHEALANALHSLESVRLVPQDDPVLSELKEDIRRAIEPPKSDGELSSAA